MVSLEQKKQSLIWFNSYLFEHQYLDKEIKCRKAKIGRVEHRLFKLRTKERKVKNSHSKCCFWF